MKRCLLAASITLALLPTQDLAASRGPLLRAVKVAGVTPPPTIIFSGATSGSGATWTATSTGSCLNTDMVYWAIGSVSTAGAGGMTLGASNVFNLKTNVTDSATPPVRITGGEANLAADRLSGTTITLTMNSTPTQAPTLVMACISSANTYLTQTSGVNTGGSATVTAGSTTGPFWAFGGATYNASPQGYSTPANYTALANTGTGIADVYVYYRRYTTTQAPTFASTNTNTSGKWLATILTLSSD